MHLCTYICAEKCSLEYHYCSNRAVIASANRTAGGYFLKKVSTYEPLSLETETEKVEYEFEFLHDNNVGHDRIIVAVQLTNEQ
jgi:hypothetical protein